MFFTNCPTVQAVKALYRKLCFQFHPDIGGDLETMKLVNIEYHEALEQMSGQKRQDAKTGKTYTYKYNSEQETKIANKVAEILKAQGGREWVVEVVGLWIWVSGTSRDDKNLLNKNGCKLRWHSKRKCWYWKPYAGKTYYSKTSSMQDLRNMYGSKTAKRQTRGAAALAD